MILANILEPIPSRSAWVSISQIDCSDLTYIFTLRPEIDGLVASIGRIGLTHQPLLQRKKNGFRLVTGYRRILALKKLGVRGFQTKIVEGGVTELRLFLFNLYENLGTRFLDEVEKSTVMEKLIDQFGLPGNKVRDEFLPLLGLGRSDKVLKLYLGLAKMEEKIKDEVASGKVSLEAVNLLAQIPESEREKIFHWIKRLRLSKNWQKEFLLLLGDLAKLKGLSPSEILEKNPKVEEIMAREDWPLPVKAKKIEEHLKGERYPIYRKAEEEYKKVVEELKLPPNLSLNPPPYFEGDIYELKIKFRDKADLKEAIGYLSHLCGGKALEKLLSIP